MKRCLHGTCMKRPSFNIEGSETPVYCKQHAEAGMVNAKSRRCLNITCMKQPRMNVEG
ncbi:unnamed protein product, partial [Scytosiphon promiscuus]